MHSTYCHCDNHFKCTCNYWCHDVKNSGGDSCGSSRGKGRGHGWGASKGRGGNSRGWSTPRGGSSGRRGKGLGGKTDKSQVRCYNCNKLGHYANKCPNCKQADKKKTMFYCPNTYEGRPGKTRGEKSRVQTLWVCVQADNSSSSHHAFKASGESKPVEAQQQPVAAPAAAAGRGHAAVGNQGGTGGVGLGAVAGQIALPQYAQVPYLQQGQLQPVQCFGMAMMALTGRAED
eukprot:2193851-Rhodomonas_salina.2